MASAASIGALRVTLGLNTAEFEKGAKKAVRQTGQLNKSFAGLRTSMAGIGRTVAGLGALVAGAFSVQAVKGALDYAASLGEVSQAIGVTVEELQVYRQLATQVNLSQEEVEKSLAKLTLTIGKATAGASAQQKAFAALNISLKDGEGKIRSTGDVLLDVAEKIAAIRDPAQQSAVAFSLFGKAGQKMIPFLSMGRKGLEEFAREAKESGSIIGTDLSNAADKASDKMALLNEQLRARFAKTVAENADAILGFANALSVASVQIVKFIQKYGKLIALLGGAALGSRFGLPGAIVGGVAGLAGGVALEGAAKNENMDLDFRRQQLRRAQDQFDRARKQSNSPRFFAGQLGALKRETQLTRQAIAQAKTLEAATAPDGQGGFDPGEFLGSGGGGGGGGKGKSGPSAAEIAKKAAENAARFEDDIGKLRIDRLQAEQEYTGNILRRRDVALAALDEDLASYERNLALDEELDQGRKDQLLEQQRAITAQKKWNVEQEYGVDLANQQSELTRAELQIQIEGASLRSELADNSRDRLAAELEVFDLTERLKSAELDRVLATEATASATWQVAKVEKEWLEASRDLRRLAVERQNATPAQKFTESLRLNAGQLNDAIDEIKINGLNTLNDGLTDAIVNFKSLGGVAKSVIRQILSDLLTLQIRKSIIGPLASILGLGASAAGLGSALGGGAAAAGGSFAPALPNFATGGLRRITGIAGRDRNLLSINGMPAARVSAGEMLAVIPEGQVANDQFGQGRMINHSPTFVFPGITDARGAREAASQAARRYRQEITPMRGM